MCCFRWCGRQLCLRHMPISGVNSTPRPTAVYASDPALPRRPQDSLPSCLLGFERTRLALASSFQLSSRTPHPGFGRDVYPGFLQLCGFMAMNIGRHVAAHWKMFQHLIEGDGDSADKQRAFYDEYLAVMDMTAEFSRRWISSSSDTRSPRER